MNRAVMAYLRGRSRRLAFWLWSLGVLGANLAATAIIIAFAPGHLSSDPPLRVMLWLVWALAAVRRLRDAGWPTWLAALPPVASTVAQALYLQSDGGHDVAQLLLRAQAQTAAGLFVAAAVALLGCLPSRPREVAPQDRADVFG